MKTQANSCSSSEPLPSTMTWIVLLLLALLGRLSWSSTLRQKFCWWFGTTNVVLPFMVPIIFVDEPEVNSQSLVVFHIVTSRVASAMSRWTESRSHFEVTFGEGMRKACVEVKLLLQVVLVGLGRQW